MCYEERFIERWQARAQRRRTKDRVTERTAPAVPRAPSPVSPPKPEETRKIEREFEELV